MFEGVLSTTTVIGLLSS